MKLPLFSTYISVLSFIVTTTSAFAFSLGIGDSDDAYDSEHLPEPILHILPETNYTDTHGSESVSESSAINTISKAFPESSPNFDDVTFIGPILDPIPIFPDFPVDPIITIPDFPLEPFPKVPDFILNPELIRDPSFGDICFGLFTCDDPSLEPILTFPDFDITTDPNSPEIVGIISNSSQKTIVPEPSYFSLICGSIVLFVVGRRVRSLKSD